ETMVERQPVKPGSERRVALEGPQLSERLQENFLQQILTFFGGAGHAARQGVDAARMLPVHRLEGVDISIQAAAHEIGVRAGRCGRYRLRREGDRRALPRRGHTGRYENNTRMGSPPDRFSPVPPDAVQLAHAP